MRSVIVGVAAGLMLGSLPIAAIDGTLQQSSIPYNGEALRAAIANGMSRAGAAIASADDEAPQGQH